jgi:UDP-glucuronate decarboxylase
VAETFTYAYQQETRTDVRVARIFNTFGPRMHENDGRVVSNFIIQAINGADITIYGTGAQTRSFQYVHDLVDGLMALMNQNYTQPVNLGNPDEYSIKEFASFIKGKVDSKTSKIVNLPATTDDPQQRRPDITVAKKHLDWEPRFSVAQGILETIQYFKRRLSENDL